MDYALIASAPANDSRPALFKLPPFLERLVMRFVPPRTKPVPGGLVVGAGEGAVIRVNKALQSLQNAPSDAPAVVDKAIAHARNLGARVIASLPEVARFSSENITIGTAVSSAAALFALERALRENGRSNAYRHNFALIGTAFLETLSVFKTLAEYSGGIDIASNKPMAVERIARDLWQTTGIVPRIHRNPLVAAKNARVVFIADSPPADLTFTQGSLVIDLRSAVVEDSSDVAIIRGGVLDGDQLGPLDLIPPEVAAIVEAALVSQQKPVGFTASRPNPKDLKKILTLLAKSELAVHGIWNGKDSVSMPTLTHFLT